MNTMTARTAVAWLVPFAAVAAVLGWETHWGRALDPAPPPTVPGAPAPVRVALLPEYTLPGDAEARRETVDRTLFNPTRRPAPPAPPPAAAAAKMQRGQFALTGTTLVDGKATAFLREVNGGKARRVQKGETINGILVEDVAADHVRLSQNGESEELVLKIAAGPRTTIQPAAPAAAAAPHPGAPQNATAQNVPGAPVVTPEIAELLAQRRRAARQAQVGAQQGGAGAQQGGSAAAAPTPGVPPPPASLLPKPPQGGDPQWSAVYQRMMQQRR
jgi:hypothetical protein